MATRCVSIIVASHHPVVVCGLMTVLRAEDDFDVVASCRDGRTCLQAIHDLSPDVAVLDAALPGRSGLQVLTAAKSEQLCTRLIFLSASSDDAKTEKLIESGAYGVLSMEAPADAVVRCLREALSGLRSLSSPKTLNGHGHSPRGSSKNRSTALTDREHQIMRLVCEGLSNKDIGRQANLSGGTVKVHLHHIFEKLAIHNRTALAMLAAGDTQPSRYNREPSSWHAISPAVATHTLPATEPATRARPKGR
jgi:two-component system, NarL family, nitrate/nitrite response regulator NarL